MGRSRTVLVAAVLGWAMVAGCFGSDGEVGTRKVVGPGGDTVVSPDARMTLEVGAGALDSEVTLTIEVTTQVPSGAIGTAYEIGPTGTQFAQPVTLVFEYDPEQLGGVPPSQLRAATVENGQWVVLDNPQVDTQLLQVSGTTMHLTPFGVVEAVSCTTSAGACAASSDCAIGEVCVGGACRASDTCTPGDETSCTQHFECKGQAVCREDRGLSICNLTDRGGDGKCTFESTSVPSDGTADLYAPDLGCYTARVFPAGPAMVRLRGCVDVFGLDFDTIGGLEIEIYEMSQGTGGIPLGTAISDLATTVLGAGRSCGNRGAYDIGAETIPTNTALVVKIHDPIAEFVDTYEYGMILMADTATDIGDGLQTIEQPATVVATSTYQVLPQIAGISAGMEGSGDLTDGLGRGIIVGTIADCQRNEIANLTVTIDGLDPATRFVDSVGSVTGLLTYTDGNENPDMRREVTNIDGVYSAINILSGDRVITISANVGCQTIEMGAWTVPVRADSVSLFSVRGKLP